MPECSINNLTIKAEKTAEEVIKKLKSLSCKLVLAESCTAGLVSSLLGQIPGASDVLWGSFVCYTQEAKLSMLGLDNDELNKEGLVSRQTACSIAIKALQKSGADLAVSVTGIAGPTGDGSCVPVGTVWIASAFVNGEVNAKEYRFIGSRNAVRTHAAIAVLETLLYSLP